MKTKDYLELMYIKKQSRRVMLAMFFILVFVSLITFIVKNYG